ncbi:MAG: ATP-binding protein, partial [Spirochaetia bacterium]|nr:ATP-binding protein [Spirochaetia bacterium]
MAKYQFQTEVNQLLKLIIHSMYSNKDIFLREIVSNASDALDKLKYLTVSDENFKNLNFNPRIDITFDEKENILTVQDSGIGMDEKDLSDNLGTIADPFGTSGDEPGTNADPFGTGGDSGNSDEKIDTF